MTETELLEKLEQVTLERDYWRGEAMAIADLETRAHLAKQHSLTPHEAWLLATLLAKPGRVVTKNYLADHMPEKYRGEDSNVANIVNVIVCRLRKKLGRDVIETVRCAGYRISEEFSRRNFPLPSSGRSWQNGTDGEHLDSQVNGG